MNDVLEIRRIEDLQPYRLLWSSLLPQTRGASFFQSLDWLECYWRHFGQGQKLRVMIVHAPDEPLGIVPLTILREKTRAGWFRVLTYPLHDWGVFYGPIGPSPTASLTAALRYLQRRPREWDLLDLRWTNKDQHDFRRTQTAMRTAGFQGVESHWTQTAQIELAGTWDEYLDRRPVRFRSNLRRLMRRFYELADARHERFRPLGTAHGDGDPRWDLYDECVELAARTWQGSSADGTTLSHPSVRDYFRDAHEVAAAAGAVDINVLRVAGRVVAFGYNYHYRGGVEGMRIGYDPAYSKYGLGNVLYAETLRDSYQRGDHTFDMGPGSLEIKQHWLTRIAASYRYTHYPWLAPRAQVLRLKHWLARQPVFRKSDKSLAP